MQDGKALQMGTSHDLGTNFAKAFDIQYLGRDQKKAYCHTTSWGVSTRMIGAMIMVHSDDEGLVVPPRVAPTLLAIVPIYKTPEEKAKVMAFIGQIVTQVVGQDQVASAEKRNAGREILSYFFNPHTHQTVIVDDRDSRPGDKQYHWEQKGVPLRLEVGPRDVESGVAVLKHRIDRSKEQVTLAQLTKDFVQSKLDAAHKALFDKARDYQRTNTRTATSYDEMKQILKDHGGFVRCFFREDKEVEKRIKDETKATVRCIPLEYPSGAGTCIVTGRETSTEVLFAQSY